METIIPRLHRNAFPKCKANLNCRDVMKIAKVTAIVLLILHE